MQRDRERRKTNVKKNKHGQKEKEGNIEGERL